MKNEVEIVDKLNMLIIAVNYQLKQAPATSESSELDTPPPSYQKDVLESTANSAITMETPRTAIKMVLIVEVFGVEFGGRKRYKSQHLDNYTTPKNHVKFLDGAKMDPNKPLDSQKTWSFNKQLIEYVENT